jgi:hypothetical protein
MMFTFMGLLGDNFVFSYMNKKLALKYLTLVQHLLKKVLLESGLRSGVEAGSDDNRSEQSSHVRR